MYLADDEEIDLITELTNGLSGADLKAVCTEAGMFAIRDKREEVTVADFMDAVDKISNAKNKEQYQQEAGVMFG